MENRVLIFAEALDVAAEGALWYARRIGGGTFEAVHVPSKGTDTGIHALVRLHRGEPRLDVRAPGSDPTEVVLEKVARLRGSRDDVVVTVVLPEQFRQALTARGGPARAVPAQAAAPHRARRGRRVTSPRSPPSGTPRGTSRTS